jgi:hypothetical protein
MNLYIETENGTTKNNPALESNLIAAFGSIPPNWEPFTRVAAPTPGVFQILEPKPVYAKINGVWSDVWTIREMTIEEKAAKQQEIREIAISYFATREQAENWSAWTYDEDSYQMVPPIPRPAANLIKEGLGIKTVWCGAENNWKDTPKRPFDGKVYKFDFIAWQWVEVSDI